MLMFVWRTEVYCNNDWYTRYLKLYAIKSYWKVKGPCLTLQQEPLIGFKLTSDTEYKSDPLIIALFLPVNELFYT